MDIVENGKGTVFMSAEEQVKALEKRIGELELENKRLLDSVEYLTRKLFGRSTEKTSSLSLGQMSLFDEAEILAGPTAPELTLDEQDRFCEACSTTLVSVGEEFVRTSNKPFLPLSDYYNSLFYRTSKGTAIVWLVFFSTMTLEIL
jgi:hypothetical protein